VSSGCGGPVRFSGASTAAVARPRHVRRTIDQRPALVKTTDRAWDRLTGAWDWLTDLWRRADTKTGPPPRAQGGGVGPLCRTATLNLEAAVTLRFSDLNPLGRAIIIVVAALTFGVAAVSFATSYGALYAYARDTGLYSDRLTRLWPLLLDGAFIVAQLAAILAGILRGSRGWPIVTHAPDRCPDRLVQPPARRQRPRPPPGRGPPPGADDAGLRDRRADRQVGHARPRQAPRPHRSSTGRGHAAGRGLAA